jgi:hypothetical protein
MVFGVKKTKFKIITKVDYSLHEKTQRHYRPMVGANWKVIFPMIIKNEHRNHKIFFLLLIAILILKYIKLNICFKGGNCAI